MPLSADASWPEMSQLMVVGASSEACSNVTDPAILESPRIAATKSTLRQHENLDGLLRPDEQVLNHSRRPFRPVENWKLHHWAIDLRTCFDHDDCITKL